MKKYLMPGLLIFAVLLASVLGGLLFIRQSEKAAQIAPTVEVEERGDAIIVGLDPNYPPMEFTNAESEIVGFDLDLMEATFRDMGQEYRLKSIVWGEKDDELNSGKIDLIWSGLNITDERKQIYELSNSYLEGEQLFVVAVNSPIVSGSDLSFKRLAIQSGTFIKPTLTKLEQKQGASFASITEYSGVSTAMIALLSGEADVAIADGLSVRYHVSHSPGKFRILPEILMRTGGTGVAARKGNRELINRVNVALGNLEENGSLKAIRQKWFGQ